LLDLTVTGRTEAIDITVSAALLLAVRQDVHSQSGYRPNPKLNPNLTQNT